MNQKTAKKPTGTSTGRQVPSNIFDDFNFRFSSTYTVVDGQDGSHQSGGGGASSSTFRAATRPPRKPGATATTANTPADTTTGLHLTPSFASSLQQQDDARHRLQQKAKMERQAATLLAYTRSRKPEVTPSFIATAATAIPATSTTTSSSGELPQQQQRVVGAGPFKPLTQPLPPPALGLAAGVVAGTMNDETDVYTLTSKQQAEVLWEERKLNETLFDWWDTRAATRLHEKFRAEVDTVLQPALESDAMDMISREERHWLEELCGSNQPRLEGSPVCVNPKLTSQQHGLRGGADMMSRNNGLTPAGATHRGIIVPLKSMEILFRGLRAMLHERARTLLHTYEEGQWAASHACSADAVERITERDEKADAAGGGTDQATTPTQGSSSSSTDVYARQRQLAREARRAYLNRLYETESELAKDALAAAASTTTTTTVANPLTPACVSLPPDRLLQPLMVIETATSVSLLWKILEQVRSVVPGVGFALQLFRHYILPHVYENYAAVDGLLPHQMGSLCDQMSRFCALPLRAKTQWLANEAARESNADVSYLEFAMKKWALRSWRKTVADRRRKEVSREACLSLLTRAAQRGTLRAVLLAWRAETRESAHRMYMRRVDEAYRDFLASSALSAKMDHLPITLASANGSDTGISYSSRARVIATKLAEAAAHGRDKKCAKGRRAKEAERHPADRFSLPRVVGGQNVYLPSILHHPQHPHPPPPLGSAAASAGGAPTEITTAELEAGTGEPTAVARLRSVFRERGEYANGEVESERRSSDNSESSSSNDGRGGGSCSSSSTRDGGAPGGREGFSGGHGPKAHRRRLRPRGDGETLGGDDGPHGGKDRGTVGSTAADRTPLLRAGSSDVGGPFEEMLSRLHETEEVCSHLRGEIAVQARMIRRLEQEKRGLQERNRTLEASLLTTVEEKLHYGNIVQEKEFLLQERDRRIAQLKSRLRAHRNRPWQRVVIRVMGELCGASTQVAEALDEYRVHQDFRTDPNAVVAPAMSGAHTTTTAGKTEEKCDGAPLNDLVDGDGPGAREAEQERLFGALAPVILSSTRELPDALIILQDWANSALDDLQSLDDLKGGALSVRFSSFSEEVRSGVLLSRLLFYLALPRYLHRTASSGSNEGDKDDPASPDAAARRGKGGFDAEDFYGSDYPDRRRQLLEQRNVQLDSPFPVYSECFGDLLSMRPSERMALLLQFATELVAGTETAASDALALKRQAVEGAVFAQTGLAPPLATGRIELQEVVDPHSLAAGERASVVTLVALLYTRFAHPFNHKCRQSAAVERAALLHLLSDGSSSTSTSGPAGSDNNNNNNNNKGTAAGRTSFEEELLAHLDDEDKSPWQLFKERCLPVFGSDAHPFLLRGNFWPSDAFDSPALANLLGELGMALNRSLQLHRWHVTLSCLVPVVTYSGLSRAVFTGPRASPAALRIGLQQEGEWEFPLYSSCIRRVCERRGNALGYGGAGQASGISPRSSVSATPAPLLRHVAAEKNRLMAALKVTSEDLLSLFLRRSTLSPELALPTMDLGGWRLLCGDLAIVGLELGGEDAHPLDLETATALYFEAIAALHEATESPRLLAVTTADTNAETDSKAYGVALQQRRVSAFAYSGPGPSPDTLPLDDTALEGIRQQQQHDAGARRVGSSSYDGTSSAQALPGEGDFSANHHHHNNNNNGTDNGDIFAPLPIAHMAMTFTAFATAMVLVADRLYPASPAEGTPGRQQQQRLSPLVENGGAHEEEEGEHPNRWLGDALRALVRDRVLETPAGNFLLDEPRAVVRRLQMGAATQEVIALYTPALTLLFNGYSKEVYGSAGMEKEDLLALLRDAMLTSTEISQYLVYELFQYCCVTRRACEEDAAAKRREIDNKPRMPGGTSGERRRAVRAVSIVDPRTNAVSLSAGKRKDAQVLVMQGFVEFLCVLCHFKLPNPLIPVHQRLDVFLRRSVLRPLSRKVEGITPFLNQLKVVREAHEASKGAAQHGASDKS